MTTEMHPLTLAPARRAELVSGFQAAFSARPDRFLRSRRTEIGGTIPTTSEAVSWPLPSTWIPWLPFGPMDRAKFVYSLQDIPCAQWIWTGWSPDPREINTTAALVRGVAAVLSNWVAR